MRPTTPPEFAGKLAAMAKRLTLKDILQGKPLGHPLHPLLVHLPTALWPTALVFDVISFARKDGDISLTLTSWWCLLVGLVAAAAAVPAGIADWTTIHRKRPAWKIGLLHAGLNTAVMGLVVANFILRCIRGPAEPSVTVAQLTLSIISVLLLLPSGYLGGLMVYDQGIGVARTSKDYWRRIARAGGARV
jgi:uncharacterized membrane protein